MSENKRVVKKVSTSASSSSAEAKSNNLTFNKQNYIYMGVGIVLIFLGMLLMSGGHMPSGDVWDESIIYGARSTVIAPILILSGLVLEIYAIFKK
jgi:hypothetical protein